MNRLLDQIAWRIAITMIPRPLWVITDPVMSWALNRINKRNLGH